MGEHIKLLTQRAIDFYYVRYINGDSMQCELPSHLYQGFNGSDEDEIINQPEATQQADRDFKDSAFHLVRELVCESFGIHHGNQGSEGNNKTRLEWIKQKKRRTFCRAKPKSKQELSTAVHNLVSQLFIPLQSRVRKSDFRCHMKWAKKKDNVDLLLVDELCEEEADWTDYRLDETSVKLQLADQLLHHLINDTIKCLDIIEKRREEERSSM